MIHVGFVHLSEELPGVGGEAFDVAALALGVDGVEGERGLSAPRKSGHHDKFIPRQRDGNVLQVMFARPTDDDVALGDLALSFRRSGKYTAPFPEAKSLLLMLRILPFTGEPSGCLIHAHRALVYIYVRVRARIPSVHSAHFIHRR